MNDSTEPIITIGGPIGSRSAYPTQAPGRLGISNSKVIPITGERNRFRERAKKNAVELEERRDHVQFPIVIRLKQAGDISRVDKRQVLGLAEVRHQIE